MPNEETLDAVTITGSSLLTPPKHRLAILFVGHRGADEPFSVAFEVTHETLNLLRTEVKKAEQFLSMPSGTP